MFGRYWILSHLSPTPIPLGKICPWPAKYFFGRKIALTTPIVYKSYNGRCKEKHCIFPPCAPNGAQIFVICSRFLTILVHMIILLSENKIWKILIYINLYYKIKYIYIKYGFFKFYFKENGWEKYFMPLILFDLFWISFIGW